MFRGPPPRTQTRPRDGQARPLPRALACTSRASGEPLAAREGILTHAPDDPGNPAEPPVPPGHAIIGGGSRWLRGCCLELVILRTHGPPAPGGSGGSSLLPTCAPAVQDAPPGDTAPSYSSKARRQPLNPALLLVGLSPHPHARPGPPGLTMEGLCPQQRCQRPGGSSLHVSLPIALWVPSSSREGFDVMLIKKPVGRAVCAYS